MRKNKVGLFIHSSCSLVIRSDKKGTIKGFNIFEQESDLLLNSLKLMWKVHCNLSGRFIWKLMELYQFIPAKVSIYIDRMFFHLSML